MKGKAIISLNILNCARQKWKGFDEMIAADAGCKNPGLKSGTKDN